MLVGELARATGVPVRALRYYESVGLVVAQRLSNGYREYDPVSVRRARAGRHVEFLRTLVDDYPIFSLEDPMGEDDYAGWKLITEALGDRIQLVGDDVFCTNRTLLAAGIDAGYANAVLVKLNQVGTVNEMLATTELAMASGYAVVMSHRSGETEDTSIADPAAPAPTFG